MTKWLVFFLTVTMCFSVTIISLKEIVVGYDEIIDDLARAYVTDTNNYTESVKSCVDRLRDVNKDYYQYNIFRKILDKATPLDYDRETNNCYDQTKRMQQELLDIDIESSIFINKDRDHSWLGIWVEATTGDFISPQNDFQIMELRDKDLNAICTHPDLAKDF